MNERARALELLRRIERESLYASIVLIGESPAVRTLVLGVLRWRSRLDAAVRSHAPRSIDTRALEVLRIGAYQLLFMDVARHAAVSETVDLAPRHARGFVNAVLRKLAAGPPAEPRDTATRYAHPEWLLRRWIDRFGAERAAAIAAANQELSTPDVLAMGEEAPPGGAPSTLVDFVWKLGGSTAELDRDRFWPMDEGSAVIAAIAATAAGGGRLLDLAAAPGSKTRYVRRKGVPVVAHDVSLTRILTLAGGGVPVVVGDGLRPPFRRKFPAVLLDAPCSATGTLRKSPEIKWRLQEKDLAAFASLQRSLLVSALELTESVCIYSTCSLEREENDDVVSAAGCEVLDITPFVPPGARRWVDRGVLRLTPESGADGFTAFALRPGAAHHAGV